MMLCMCVIFDMIRMVLEHDVCSSSRRRWRRRRGRRDDVADTSTGTGTGTVRCRGRKIRGNVGMWGMWSSV
jgi:hypothetical protein